MAIIDSAKSWARSLKRDVVAVYFAARDPETPWALRLFALAVAAYALSPIDLIPDFIPVLGYVDDILLLPALIWLTVKLLPGSVLAECRGQADAWMAEKGAKPSSHAGALMIIVLWVAMGIAAWFWLNPQSF